MSSTDPRREWRVAPAAGALLLLALECASGRVGDPPKTLLAVFAHPDDEVFVGPLLSHYARQGARVRLVIVTDGAKGPPAGTGIPAGPETARIRAEEARCSCRALGIDPPTLLGFGDGELGRPTDPPAGYLGEVARAIRRELAQTKPDAVITWGPDGGYGHPDHRLVNAVVTQYVQAGGPSAPRRLLYPSLPADRVPRRPGDPRWAVTDPRFLTVRVPYDAQDLEATRRAFACHQSQFSAEKREALVSWLHDTLDGRVYLRPWFGARVAEDVFALEVP